MITYSSQTGHGIKSFFRKLTKPIMKLAKPVLDATVKPVIDLGVNLAGELIQDVVGGKGVKASIKARGKQFGKQAGQQALQAGIQTIAQGGRGKRKRSQTPSRSVKRKQTGGIFPPVHYPLGNYPPGYYPGYGWNNISTVTGRGKRRSGKKKRKSKKQTGAGKKRKSKKQTGAGKKRKPKKQTGAGKKRKQKKSSDIFG